MSAVNETKQNQKQTLRQKVYQLLETGESESLISRVIDWFLIALIAVNVIAVIMETVPSFQSEHKATLFWLELFSVSIFTIEYIGRYWTCPEARQYRADTPAIARIKYIFTPMAIIDLIAIAPFYVAFLFNLDLRFLRVLRLLRIFKLTRYSEAMTTLLKVLKDEMSSFAAALFIMIVIMIIAASGIYLVEHDHQPEIYGSIPQSMWWSIVTLTTVGYGDVYPITTLGKVFAAIIMVVGVGLVALPTGILASSFSDNLRRGREKMTKELSEALADGVLDDDESRYLNEIRKQLGLSEFQFRELKETLLEHHQHVNMDNSIENNHNLCPHCGKSTNGKQKD